MPVRLRVLLVMAIAGAVAACAPPTVAGPSALPAATSYESWAAGTCRAFDALFEAIGNPDTGNLSAISKELDRAVAAHDRAAADRAATLIVARLEEGRREAAAAAGWTPAGPMMAHLDRLLVAFEAWTAAKQAAASGQGDASSAQQAFEAAGGLAAWRGMFEAQPSIPRPATGSFGRCPNVPISL